MYECVVLYKAYSFISYVFLYIFVNKPILLPLTQTDLGTLIRQILAKYSKVLIYAAENNC